jgi:hypothetical protein
MQLEKTKLEIDSFGAFSKKHFHSTTSNYTREGTPNDLREVISILSLLK